VREKPVLPKGRIRSVGAKVKFTAPFEASGADHKKHSSDSKLMIKYKPIVQDVAWAQDGVVATVSNGESIPLLQHRIFGAGFESLNLIPMGADKVMVKASGIDEVKSILSGAAEFFNSLFSSFTPWNKDCRKFERGAWIRLFGVPLHAWNEKKIDFVFLILVEF
jgi:hypothetical protein